MLFKKPLSIVGSVLLLISLSTLSALTACGGSSSSDSSASQTGDLNLSITDAPVDNADIVNVQFDAITVKHKNGGTTTFNLEAVNINLLDYTGGQSRILLQTEGNESLTLPAGEYNWMRFDVSADVDGEMDSFIEFDDGSRYDLEVPSETGLKLNTGFTIPVDGVANFTVDFDLRHSIIGDFEDNQSGLTFYKLKPVLRLVDNSEVGTLTGTVDSGLIVGCDSPSVYLFAGELTEGQLDDMDIDVDGTTAEDDVEPIATVNVPTEGGGDYDYTIGFISAGTHTVAFTCDEDDPAVNDTLSFLQVQTTEITASEATTVDFSSL